MKKRTGLYIILALCISQNIYTKENIVKFDNKFALSFINKYNFIEYFQEMNKGFYSYDIIDVGLGVSYKNALFNFNFTIPLVYILNETVEYTFDLGLKYCGNKYYFEGNFEYYNNFNYDKKPVNMEILSVGMFMEYVFNNENHSLGSVYALNSHQLKSSGSFLTGIDLLFTNMKSTESNCGINNLVIFGPNIGYSYIFIFSGNWFFNAMLITAPAIGINYDDRSFYFTPQIKPKLATGYHGKSWSANLVLESNFSFYIKNIQTVNVLETADAGFVISKRF